MSKRALASGVAFVLACAVTVQAADHAPVPNFSSIEYGWVAQAPNFQIPPGGGPRHVTQHPNYPWKAPGRGEAPHWRVADLDNPILQPWAREALRKMNDKIIGGGTGYTRQVSCWPMGTPAFLLLPAQPLYFIQTPKEVTLIHQMDQQVRRVYMNVPHSKNVKQSWYGESVGHYEGDTLVVDTIGMNDQTWVDNFRTPHSDKLHVIERFRLINDGKNLEVRVHIEDPGAYTTAWDTMQRYDRADQQYLESVCAENNPLDHGDLDPMPEAKTPDF